LKREVVLAGAAVLYVAAAWSVKPGFYDGFPAPQYDYVSPPARLASGNVQPTSGSGQLRVGANGLVSAGFVATHDQPIAQAGLDVPSGALSPPQAVNAVMIRINPYVPPKVVPNITLEGNVYCITSNTTFNPGAKGQVTLLVPPAEPFPTAIYYAPSLTGQWTSIGGQVDLATYLMAAPSNNFGCFAVGYPTPKSGGGPTVGGSLLVPIVAILIAVVLLAGLPIATRRRATRKRD
jgi:hypothetical protein